VSWRQRRFCPMFVCVKKIGRYEQGNRVKE
jgi:hypothetical protein